jgi:hypothetical protein
MSDDKDVCFVCRELADEWALQCPRCRGIHACAGCLPLLKDHYGYRNKCPTCAWALPLARPPRWNYQFCEHDLIETRRLSLAILTAIAVHAVVALVFEDHSILVTAMQMHATVGVTMSLAGLVYDATYPMLALTRGVIIEFQGLPMYHFLLLAGFSLLYYVSTIGVFLSYE